MSYSLLNVPTSDAYGDTAQLLCPSSTAIALTVANAAVIYQLGYGHRVPQWDVEHFALPGVWTLPAADAMRCKSAAAGAPAQISASAF